MHTLCRSLKQTSKGWFLQVAFLQTKSKRKWDKKMSKWTCFSEYTSYFGSGGHQVILMIIGWGVSGSKSGNSFHCFLH